MTPSRLLSFSLTAATLTTLPLAASAQTTPTPATTPSTTPFTRVVVSHFAEWDKDHDGVLSMPEIEKLVVDPNVKGEDAAAVATLDMLAHSTKTHVAPPVTLDYLAKYAADSHSKAYPAFDLRFKACAARIAATPAGLYATSASPHLASVCQGMLGDCYFVSVVGAMVNRDPDQVRSMITTRPDGSYDVVFPAGQHAHVLPITDAEVALSSNSMGTGRWLATLESAFGNIRSQMKAPVATTAATTISEPDPTRLATDIIRTGGSMHEVIQFLTGHGIGHVAFRKDSEKAIAPASEMEPLLPAVRAGVSSALKDHRLVGTGTTLADRPKGISGDHAYTIIGYDAATDIITIWNPHGQNFTPAGPAGLVNGYPTKNGVFTMPLIEFAQVFAGVNWELPTAAVGRTAAR